MGKVKFLRKFVCKHGNLGTAVVLIESSNGKFMILVCSALLLNGRDFKPGQLVIFIILLQSHKEVVEV